MGCAEFTADHNDGFLQQTGRLEIHDQRGDRPIGLAGQLAVDKNIVMAVPGYIFPKIDLRHAHAALDESAGNQAATSEVSVPCRRAKESRSC